MQHIRDTSGPIPMSMTDGIQHLAPSRSSNRLSDLAKEDSPLVLVDTFARETESGENLPVLDLCGPVKSPDPLIQGLINRLPEPDGIWPPQ
jgi:hypothetical protein